MLEQSVLPQQMLWLIIIIININVIITIVCLYICRHRLLVCMNSTSERSAKHPPFIHVFPCKIISNHFLFSTLSPGRERWCPGFKSYLKGKSRSTSLVDSASRTAVELLHRTLCNLVQLLAEWSFRRTEAECRGSWEREMKGTGSGREEAKNPPLRGGSREMDGGRRGWWGGVLGEKAPHKLPPLWTGCQ